MDRGSKNDSLTFYQRMSNIRAIPVPKLCCKEMTGLRSKRTRRRWERVKCFMDSRYDNRRIIIRRRRTSWRFFLQHYLSHAPIIIIIVAWFIWTIKIFAPTRVRKTHLIRIVERCYFDALLLVITAELRVLDSIYSICGVALDQTQCGPALGRKSS